MCLICWPRLAYTTGLNWLGGRSKLGDRINTSPRLGELLARLGELLAPLGKLLAPPGEPMAPLGELLALLGKLLAPLGERSRTETIFLQHTSK